MKKSFRKKHVLRDISFIVSSGESVGLIGKSGSGKSTIARCIVDLERPDGGDMLWKGSSLSDKKIRRESRRSIQIVFQDPRSSLNPGWTTQKSLREAFKCFHAETILNEERIFEDLLVSVGLDEGYLKRYPHEMSTGQCQRVCIARALVANPELIILDECLSALDVSVQAQVMELLQELHDTRNVSYLFISHDIAVVASLCDRILVIDQGCHCRRR
ncbi:ABC transporter ATP-binding protein [Paenibacillus sp. SYP-B3998]|uniref:ABC transporter ATP-binding protein n=1 Tax=Paenibacillus sp. SYP-B3998 TaxID=2678564 RepID=A0A6G3ZQN9_9BACL|nr:dipeptide/oligopeptide/nickel ABC transporter ATP-binding protein [Paenibacillus sp. SYP-B3998]NEW04452.1 ABC transporter ATP-binding protein [Paenibacillus sp. SYP-B3998]